MKRTNHAQCLYLRRVNVVITQSADFGIFKQFRESFVINPDLLCNATEVCLDKVLSGSHVYMNVSIDDLDLRSGALPSRLP